MAPSGVKRVKGVQVYRPFMYGTVARPVPPEKRGPNFPTDHTHRWTVFVRGINDSDLTYYIKKVQFKLHETYPNRLRNVESPPFEVTETGWGEFEIQIKIYFVNEANEKPVTLFHFLKIRQYTGLEGLTPEEQLIQQNNNPDPVYSIQYDEMVFNEPTEAFYEILQKKGDARLPTGGRNASKNPKEPFARDMENEELDRLQLAIRKVNEQIKAKKDAIVAREMEVVELRKKREEKEEEMRKKEEEEGGKEEEE